MKLAAAVVSLGPESAEEEGESGISVEGAQGVESEGEETPDE